MINKIKTVYYQTREKWRRLRNIPQSCPLNFGQAFTPAGEDYWEKRGSDLGCSFCGSLHPEQFLKHIDDVIAFGGEGYSIELNDSKDKMYVTRPGISNASQGCIKFKLAHLYQYNETIEMAQRMANSDKIKLARKLSWDKLMEKFNLTKEKV